jgi:hypothetical protein
MSATHELTANPQAGDYMLVHTGSSPSVLRSNGDGTAKTVSASDSTIDEARSRMLTFASHDQTAAWESVGTQVYKLLESFRPNTEE